MWSHKARKYWASVNARPKRVECYRDGERDQSKSVQVLIYKRWVIGLNKLTNKFKSSVHYSRTWANWRMMKLVEMVFTVEMSLNEDDVTTGLGRRRSWVQVQWEDFFRA